MSPLSNSIWPTLPYTFRNRASQLNGPDKDGVYVYRLSGENNNGSILKQQDSFYSNDGQDGGKRFSMVSLNPSPPISVEKYVAHIYSSPSRTGK